MVRPSLRLSSSVSSSASKAATQFLERAAKNGVLVQEQLFDGNQLQKLSLALNRSLMYKSLNIYSRPPPNGTPLPPGYHLVYFTPNGCEQDLGIDGTDRTVNPPHPFTRRMWAGGSVQWARDNRLRIGQAVRETTEILSAQPKTTRGGEPMIVVDVKKTFENEKGLAVTENR
ncbi:hypothetical protein B7463_g4000, partial [Scytalidium lignicola]